MVQNLVLLNRRHDFGLSKPKMKNGFMKLLNDGAHTAARNLKDLKRICLTLKKNGVKLAE